MQKLWQVWPASLCRWQWSKPNMITKSSFCLCALSQFWIRLEFTYCLRWNQALSRDVYSEKFITMYHIQFWDRIMPQWLRCFGREHIPLLTAHIRKEHFIWMSMVPDGRAPPKEPPFPCNWMISKTSLRSPWASLLAGSMCVCVCVCLTESGDSIPLVHSSRGHHLLAVRDLGGDHRLSQTTAPCLF